MNKNLVAAAVMSLPVLVACENRDPEMNNPGELTLITATICDAEPSTRSAIDPTEYAGGHVGILWTPEDIVGVYSTDDKNIPFRNQSETAIGRTQFAGECASPQYAYYPYHEENATRDMTAVKGHLSAEQTFDSSTGAISGDYKYGTPSATTPGEFTFRHIFSLLRFNLDITGINALSGESLKSVTLTLPEGRKLAGDFTFDITTGYYTFTGNTSNAVTMRWADMPQLEENKTYQAYMSCAPDMKADDVIMVTVTTSRHTASFSAKIAYDFAANTVYTFNLKLSDFNDGSHEFAVEELPVEPEEETANCYMITTAGEHDFKATVIGNGEKGIIKGAGFHTENPYINPQSAKLLWEDTQGFITDVTLRDGRVHYTTTGNVGNAVIAVYSGPNATGDILWSWHIWGVGDTLPADYEVTTKVGGNVALGTGSVVLMDRNLGAYPSTDEQRLETTRTAENEAKSVNCMLYQWGRKDPFPNADKYYVDGNEVNIATTFPVWQPTTTSEATIAASILRPGYMINRPADDTSINNWLGKDVTLLWGDDKFSGQLASGWTNVKTIYDPSPVGYRVANFTAFTDFIPVNSISQTFKGGSTMSGDGDDKYPSILSNINCVLSIFQKSTVNYYLPKGMHMERIGFAYGSSSNTDKIFGYGLYLKRNKTDAEGNFFSMSGYRFPNTSGSRDNYAKASNIWMSCGAHSNTNGAGMFVLSHFVYLTGSGNYKEPDKGLTSIKPSIQTQYSAYPWCANAVRCVREK